MNLLDWLLVVLVARLRPLGLLAGLHHRRLRDRRAAARRPRSASGSRRSRSATPNPSLLVSLGALFIVILCRLARPGAAPVRRRADSATRSPGSRPAPSTPSGGAALARWPCCSSRGRSASRSPARGSARITPLVRNSTVLGEVDDGLPEQRRRRARGVQRRGRHQLLPALPRAVRARADHRASAPARSGCSRDPDVERRRATSVLKIRGTNELRPRRRGHRLRLRRRARDDQRARRGRRRRPRGGHRRRDSVAPRSSTTTPTSTSPCSPSTSRDLPDRCRSTGPPRPRTARGPRLPAGRAVRRAAGPDPRRAAAALPEHLRRRRGPSARSSRCADCPAGQLRRPDRRLGRRRRRRGLRGVGDRPRHRLRADRRPGRRKARRPG